MNLYHDVKMWRSYTNCVKKISRSDTPDIYSPVLTAYTKPFADVGVLT